MKEGQREEEEKRKGGGGRKGELDSKVVSKCIQQSHKIWCQRNWSQ